MYEQLQMSSYRLRLSNSPLNPPKDTRPKSGKYYAGVEGVYIGRDPEVKNITLVLRTDKDARVITTTVATVQEAKAFRLANSSGFVNGETRIPTAVELEKVYRYASAVVEAALGQQNEPRWCLVQDEDGAVFQKADLYTGEVLDLTAGEPVHVYLINRVWVE